MTRPHVLPSVEQQSVPTTSMVEEFESEAHKQLFKDIFGEMSSDSEENSQLLADVGEVNQDAGASTSKGKLSARGSITMLNTKSHILQRACMKRAKPQHYTAT